MRSRSARVVSAAVAWIVLVAAGFFVFQSQQLILSDAQTLRAADLRAREAADALVDLRVAQQAYVAAGQGVDFWMPKVLSTKDQVMAALAGFRDSIRSQQARTELDEAVAAMGEFAEVDKRARDYIHSRQMLMAGDVIFTEGGQLATVAARKVELARIAEHQAFDAEEAGRRKVQAYAIGGASLLAGLIALLLAVTGRSTTVEPAMASLGLSPRAPETTRHELVLRSADGEEGIISHATPTTASTGNPKPEPAVSLTPVTAPRTAVVLKTAAELATDLGRVRTSADLERLLGRTADLLDAAGVVVWMGAADAAGESLRPVLAHGYTPQILARMPSVPCTADNAAAAAYRTGTLQIVRSRAGSAAVAPGAIVAPILGTDGCIGALSAEIKNGGEGSEAVQAVAAIVAAQLAGILAVTSVEAGAPEMRTATAS
jgi:hypothetical protein